MINEGTINNNVSIDKFNTTISGINTSIGNLNTSVGNLNTSVGNLNTSVGNLNTGKTNVAADNLSAVGKNTVINLTSPSYASAVGMTSPYTAPKHGFATVGIQGATNGSASSLQVSINDTVRFYVGGRGDNGGPRQEVFFAVSKGDKISWVITNTTAAYCSFFPAKGAS